MPSSTRQQQQQHHRQSLNAPSGIAQLRKTSEQNISQQCDPMNLDDFIITDNIATPHAHEAMKHADERPSNSVSSAIPINKSRRELTRHTFVPQSVPVPPHRQRVQDEFGYVTRHVRKTSIDDRRVGDLMSYFLFAALNSHLAIGLRALLTIAPCRIENVQPTSRLMCPLSTAAHTSTTSMPMRISMSTRSTTLTRLACLTSLTLMIYLMDWTRSGTRSRWSRILSSPRLDPFSRTFPFRPLPHQWSRMGHSRECIPTPYILHLCKQLTSTPRLGPLSSRLYQHLTP